MKIEKCDALDPLWHNLPGVGTRNPPSGTRATVTLHSPLDISGEVWWDTDFVIADDFDPDVPNGITFPFGFFFYPGMIYGANSSGPTGLVNCSIRWSTTWRPSWVNPGAQWEFSPGNVYRMPALGFMHCSNFFVFGCEFIGLPYQAIYIRHCNDFRIEHSVFNKVDGGIYMEWEQTGGGTFNEEFVFRHLTFYNGWNDYGPGLALGPSDHHPAIDTAFNNFIAMHGRSGLIEDCVLAGEGKGIKLVTCKDIEIRRCLIPEMGLSGMQLTSTNNANFLGGDSYRMSNIELDSCIFQMQFASAPRNLVGSGLFCFRESTGVGAFVTDCTFYRPPASQTLGGGWGQSSNPVPAIYLSDKFNLDVRGSRFYGSGFGSPSDIANAETKNILDILNAEGTGNGILNADFIAANAFSQNGFP